MNSPFLTDDLTNAKGYYLFFGLQHVNKELPDNPLWLRKESLILISLSLSQDILHVFV